MAMLNEAAAVFLINDNVRAVLCVYENEEEKPKQEKYLFKTFDPSISKGDFVIVPTDTRHKMTVVKVAEVDAEDLVNFESPVPYKWIVGKVELADHTHTIAQETEALQVIKSAEKAKKRRELKEAMLADSEEKLKTLSITARNDIPAIETEEKPEA